MSYHRTSLTMTALEKLALHSAPEGDCLLWKGPSYEDYGHLSWNNRHWSVHRLAYVSRHGEPPPEKPFILHSCDRPNCWADAHLRPGTHVENMADARRRKRGVANNANGLKTHCDKGHEFTPENTREGTTMRRGHRYVYRYCRACHRDYMREWQKPAARLERLALRARVGS